MLNWYKQFDSEVSRYAPDAVTHIDAWRGLYDKGLSPRRAAMQWIMCAQPKGARYVEVTERSKT